MASGDCQRLPINSIVSIFNSIQDLCVTCDRPMHTVICIQRVVQILCIYMKLCHVLRLPDWMHMTLQTSLQGEGLDDGSLLSGSSELLTLNGSCGTKYYKLPRNIMRFCPNMQQDKILFHKAPLISLAIDPDNDRIFCKFWFSSVPAHG